MRARALLLLLSASVACATSQPAPPPRAVVVEEPPPRIIIKKARPAEPPPVDDAPADLPAGDDAPPALADEAAPAPAAPHRGRPDAPPPVAFDPKKTMTLHLLDVGQGASTLIELPCGAILVDTGGEVNDSFDGVASLAEDLEAFFARRTDLARTIDLLVITHPHIDHVRGLPMVLDKFVVKNVVDNGRPGDDIVKEPLAQLRDYVGARKNGVRYRAITVDDAGSKGFTDSIVDPVRCRGVDPKVRVLAGARTADPGWGLDRWGHAYLDNENNHSVVVRVDFGKSSLLITGDLEEIALKDLVHRLQGTKLLDVDLYEAGHHGSANGTTQELLEAATPQVALIATGDAQRRLEWTAWQYGHPRQKVVDLLEGNTSQRRDAVDVPVGTGQRKFKRVRVERAIYATGWDGDILVDFSTDGRVVVRPPVDDHVARASN